MKKEEIILSVEEVTNTKGNFGTPNGVEFVGVCVKLKKWDAIHEWNGKQVRVCDVLDVTPNGERYMHGGIALVIDGKVELLVTVGETWEGRFFPKKDLLKVDGHDGSTLFWLDEYEIS